MSTMTAPPACQCRNRYETCPVCKAKPPAVKPCPPQPAPEPAPAPKPPRRPNRPQPTPPPMPTTHQLINAAEVARLLGVGVRTVWRLTELGRFIQPARFTRKLVRWNRADVLAWIEKTATAAQAEDGGRLVG